MLQERSPLPWSRYVVSRFVHTTPYSCQEGCTSAFPHYTPGSWGKLQVIALTSCFQRIFQNLDFGSWACHCITFSLFSTYKNPDLSPFWRPGSRPGRIMTAWVGGASWKWTTIVSGSSTALACWTTRPFCFSCCTLAWRAAWRPGCYWAPLFAFLLMGSRRSRRKSPSAALEISKIVMKLCIGATGCAESGTILKFHFCSAADLQSWCALLINVMTLDFK